MRYRFPKHDQLLSSNFRSVYADTYIPSLPRSSQLNLEPPPLRLVYPQSSGRYGQCIAGHPPRDFPPTMTYTGVY